MFQSMFWVSTTFHRLLPIFINFASLLKSNGDLVLTNNRVPQKIFKFLNRTTLKLERRKNWAILRKIYWGVIFSELAWNWTDQWYIPWYYGHVAALGLRSKALVITQLPLASYISIDPREGVHLSPKNFADVTNGWPLMHATKAIQFGHPSLLFIFLPVPQCRWTWVRPPRRAPSPPLWPPAAAPGSPAGTEPRTKSSRTPSGTPSTTADDFWKEETYKFMN